MIDHNTYRQLHFDADEVEPPPPKRDDIEQAAMDRDEPPEEPFILLLPETMSGYGFHDKKWSELPGALSLPIQD